MGDFIYDEFKERVKDFGIDVGPEDQDGNIAIEYGDTQITINLGNARKSYAEQNDLSHLDKIISSLHQSLMGLPVPDWDTAAPNLFFMLTRHELSPEKLKEYITEPIADKVIKVFIHHHNGQYIWISHSILQIWNVSLEAFKGQCNYNMDNLLDDSKIVLTKLPGKGRLGAIESEISWLNSALLFTKNFRKKIEETIGWPVYFVIPAREFCYFVNIKRKDSLDLLTQMFNDIYRKEDLRLTREIYSLTDKGIRATDNF